MQLNQISKKYSSDSGSGKLLTRDKIKEKYKWNLADIYQSNDIWEKEFKWVEENINEYKKFEGRLSHSPDTLLECLQFDDLIGIKLDRLHLYASLAKDSDMRVHIYQSMDERMRSLFSRVSSASSFIRPEILSVNNEELLKSVEQNEGLKIYRHFLEDIIRTKTHTLSKEVEEVLALAGETSQIPYNAFSIFTNADIKFPVIKDEDGNDFEISHARYYSAMYSKDRNFRQRAYTAYYKQFKDYANTFSVLFNGNLKTNMFSAKARKYESSREAALDRNNIPVSVYDSLIKTVNDNLKPLHRWASLRKRLLKVEELHPYDLYMPLFQTGSEKNYSYDEAMQIVLKALEPMGKE
ncbi:MAG: M3 family metallopeptidase, partial [Ignavibacteriaceae bacterium]|nr:M3 family metallopeptidase [Ignavibacteriaceae bacterium]